MFERFTDRARRVVVLAQEEARLLDHNYIGTEHLLLGVLAAAAEGDSTVRRILDSAGADRAALRTAVIEIIGHGDHPPSGHVPFTPRARHALEMGLREALHLGHRHIGPEHLLLGLAAEGEGVAAQVLHDHSAGLDVLRRETAAISGAVDEMTGRVGTFHEVPGEASAQPVGFQPVGFQPVIGLAGLAESMLLGLVVVAMATIADAGSAWFDVGVVAAVVAALSLGAVVIVRAVASLPGGRWLHAIGAVALIVAAVGLGLSAL